MKKLTATSTALLIAGLSIFPAVPVFAAAGSGSIGQWAASADIVGIPGQSITITDSTYAGCLAQFNYAMTTYASTHGYEYTNIRQCHEKLPGISGGHQIQHERKIERKR